MSGLSTLLRISQGREIAMVGKMQKSRVLVRA
jgi:hypothetical protein